MTTPATRSDTSATVWHSDSLADPGGSPWDLLVVGGGTAGLVAAQTARALGASVLLVERERTGGDCLWTGCVPSKSVLAAAQAAADARAGAALGVHVDGVRVDLAGVAAHVRGAVRTIEPVDSPAALRRAGVRVAHGTLRLTGDGAAEVGGAPVRFRQGVLATGSEPVVPDIPGLADANPLTSDTVWDHLEELEGRLLVLGGGPIGCELAQGLARLGVTVVLVEHSDRVLEWEHPKAAEIVAGALRADGVDLRLGTALTGVERTAGGWTAHLEHDRGPATVGFDRVLVAVGRRPRTAGLGLDQVGVELHDRGHVVVDDRLRTTNPRIWAAGDLTGHPPFTHTAGAHGSLAASNAVLGLRRTVSPHLIPRVTYTSPEVAAFGTPTEEGHTVRHVRHDEIDRAVTEDRTGGFSELVLDRRGRVVGATVVGPRAGETLAEAVLAAHTGARARTVAGAVHAYPTWSDGLWKSALAQGRAELGSPLVSRATSALVRLRRAWMDHRP